MKTKPEQNWRRMDNAAILYSALQKETYSATYRFSVRMRDEVDPAALSRAIKRTMPRFPTFCMRIRKGFFWYYLEKNTSPGPFLREDVADPCQPFRFQEDGHWLVRFYYYKKRISIEIFHALADGAGALTFFRTLLAVYLRELGVDIPAGEGVLDVDAPVPPQELEDAYARYAGSVASRRPHLPRAFANTGTPEPFYTFHVTMGYLPLDRLKERAAYWGGTVTEYLAAVLIHVILERQKAQNPYRSLPVALAVPVNLRSLFPTETLQNFILTVRPAIDPSLGEYTFGEIVRHVRCEMRLHINRPELRAAFTGNVRLTKNRFLQLIPLFIKEPVMAANYRMHGVRPYSCTFTNPGEFSVPEAMRPYIEGAEVILGQATVPRCHCAAISYNGTMEVTLAGTQVETDTEREFFRFLVNDKIPVTIHSNR